jgi:predicted AAA+ superfamily ATPase
MREFNVTGICIPGKHYMVDISNKVSQIFAMVEKGQYFTINRARQYGKTTTIRQLEAALLEKGYQVARISFEGIGDTPFENEENFCQNEFQK